MTYGINFMISQEFYQHLDVIKTNSLDDSGTELMNVPFASHNNRFFTLAKTVIEYHDFIGFVSDS